MSTGCLIVIPARLASTRLPEKLLRKAAGKSVLQHTFEAAKASSVAEDVVVAVDSEQLAGEVESFGGRWLMTSPNCASGTDRIAEVAKAMPEIEVFVNVQGDEPEIDPAVIDRVAQALLDNPTAAMSTAAAPIRDRETLEDPACVKVVMTQPHAGQAQIAAGQEIAGGQETAGGQAQIARGQTPIAEGQTEIARGQSRAVYFSRAAVPFDRDGIDDPKLSSEPPIYWHHLGLYAYRREFLIWFAAEPPSPLERIERLEQLRAIEAGKKIVVIGVESATAGINTQKDLDAFIARLNSSESR